MTDPIPRPGETQVEMVARLIPESPVCDGCFYQNCGNCDLFDGITTHGKLAECYNNKYLKYAKRVK